MLHTSKIAASVVGAWAVTSMACAHPVFHSSGARYPAYPSNCRIRVLGTHPGPGYEEVGTITIEGDREGGAGNYDNGEQFVEEVRAQVCAAGADAVATEVNGSGQVARGIAFRKVPLASGPAPVATASLAADTGCTPICSPGFDCSQHVCIPVCNPACARNEICGRDRLCHLATEYK